MPEAKTAPRRDEDAPDPAFKHRAVAAAIGGILLILGALTAGVVTEFRGGDRTAFFQTPDLGRALLLAGVAAAAVYAVMRPDKVDSRLGRYIMLAAAIVGTVAGLAEFVAGLEAIDPVESLFITDRSPGPGAWSLIAAGLVYLYLFWRKELWPESRMLQELQAAAMKRKR